MVDKISGLGQSPMPQNPQEPVKKADNKPVTIMAGMTVADVQQNGSKAQQIVAEIMDQNLYAYGTVCNGIYEKDEARIFNSFDFTLDENNKVFTASSKNYQQNISIKYDTLEQLKENLDLLPRNMYFSDYGGDVTLDLTNKTAKYVGIMEGYSISLDNRFDNITIKDCFLSDIYGLGAEEYGESAFQGNLILENVARVGAFGRTKKCTVNLTKDATLEARGNDNKIDIKRH